jgi:hypothetical protein
MLFGTTSSGPNTNGDSALADRMNIDRLRHRIRLDNRIFINRAFGSV